MIDAETNKPVEQSFASGVGADQSVKKRFWRNSEGSQADLQRKQDKAEPISETVLVTNVRMTVFSKNYLIVQKAEYMRFSSQINTMIQNSKEINSQLTLLASKFDEFQKNVGI